MGKGVICALCGGVADVSWKVRFGVHVGPTCWRKIGKYLRVSECEYNTLAIVLANWRNRFSYLDPDQDVADRVDEILNRKIINGHEFVCLVLSLMEITHLLIVVKIGRVLYFTHNFFVSQLMSLFSDEIFNKLDMKYKIKYMAGKSRVDDVFYQENLRVIERMEM